ncbi:hypothetical protein [Streptomyces sp. NPDC127114]|uniref:hypothetical protein n=1 Tax=Streptomyces sp. NPDC127114 TaxID=3345366 RepID=UPI003625C961
MQIQGNGTAENDNQPSTSAHVTFSTLPDGPALAVGVPAEHSQTLMRVIAAGTGIGGSTFAPYLMARGLHQVSPGMPWQLQAGLILLSALLPLAYFLLSKHRS